MRRLRVAGRTGASRSVGAVGRLLVNAPHRQAGIASGTRPGGPTFAGMKADDETALAIQALVEKTYEAMSTPGSDVAHLFGTSDIAIAGSGREYSCAEIDRG